MKTPEPYNDTCPFCGKGKIILKKDWFDYTTENDNPTRWEGYQWYYECDVCRKDFTTTDSDTISMEQMKKTPVP